MGHADRFELLDIRSCPEGAAGTNCNVVPFAGDIAQYRLKKLTAGRMHPSAQRPPRLNRVSFDHEFEIAGVVRYQWKLNLRLYGFSALYLSNGLKPIGR